MLVKGKVVPVLF